MGILVMCVLFVFVVVVVVVFVVFVVVVVVVFVVFVVLLFCRSVVMCTPLRDERRSSTSFFFANANTSIYKLFIIQEHI